jgi:hypothetical protein
MGQGLRASQVKKSPNAIGAIKALEAATDKPSASILKKIKTIEARLKGDCQCGEVIPKPYPRALSLAYGMQNLYKMELPTFWRLLYTIVRDGKSRYVIILEIVDHKTYYKWFA